jgi:hypothetical protein
MPRAASTVRSIGELPAEQLSTVVLPLPVGPGSPEEEVLR